MTKIIKPVLTLAIAVLSIPARSSEYEDLLKKGDEFFAKRSTIENCLKAIDCYERASSLEPNNIPVRLKLARLTHWTAGELGLKTMDKKKRIEILQKGVKASEEILKIDPKNPQAHYWRIWNLAAQTVAQGVLTGGYSFKEAIVGTIFVANGDINYFYGGLYRYWARVIYEIPGILGKFFHFNDQDSIWLYNQALKAEPNFLMTRFWMAESYLRMKNQNKAIQQLKIIINTPPESIPDALIENQFYQQQAKALLAELEK